MVAISTVVDDFSSTLNTTRWPANNGVTVSSNAAALACNTDYSDLGTAHSYTLDSVYAKVTPAPANGGTTGNCYLRMALFPTGQPEGTFLGIVCDTIEGTIYFQKAVDYWDDSGPGLTYSATTHAWWKIALSGTNVVFSTSTNGTTWTARYTTARPSYYNASTFILNFEAHRDSGTTNTAIIDNVNTTSSVTVVTGALSLAAGATQAVAGSGKTTGALSATAAGAQALSGYAKTTGAMALTSAAGQALAGARSLAGATSLTAGATLTLAGIGKAAGASTMGGTGGFAVDGAGTAYAAADLSAGSGIELTGGRLMNPNVGGAAMNATGSFSLTVAGSVTTFASLDLAGAGSLDAEAAAMTTLGELAMSGTGAMTVLPHTATVVTGELLLVAGAGYHQWANKTVNMVAFGYLTGEVDA